MPLDWFENRFFAEDGRSLICSTHSSLFRPDTGGCVAGPGCGTSLIQLPLKIQDGEVFVAYPEEGHE
jgi:nitrite reductase/ring-hydroxylating ferredoxin subunit